MTEKITVVTGFSPEGYKLYGKKMVDTFHQYWPKSVDLIAYVEEPTWLPRGEARLLPPDVYDFIERNQGIPERCGTAPVDGWSDKDRRKGYSYRYDAVKFCRMAMFPADIVKYLKEGILVWLDGDVVTLKEVPEDFVTDLLSDAHCVYLGRAKQHSEIGFIAYRLPEAILLINRFANTYESDRVFQFSEWHSAYVWDVNRKRCETAGFKTKNLTPGGRGHVWCSSPLAEYSDHIKGRRKELGYSKEHPYYIGCHSDDHISI